MKNEAMAKTAEYIDTHLGETLNIAELARLAGYSQVQLVRSFLEQTGFTPADYIRRRRLYFAAKALVDTNQKIADIAMESGFQSHDGFTRAFRAVYRMPPETFRRKGCHVPAFYRPVQGENPLFGCVEIITLPEVKLIGIERKFRAREQAWEAFNRKYNHTFRDAPNRVYPTARNATHVLSVLQPNGDFRIFAGMEVTSLDAVPKGAQSYILPAQEYARLCFEGGLDDRECTDFLYTQWLGKSGCQSGQTRDFPVATLEYFTPQGVEPYEEAVYIPILPVVPVRESLPPCRAYRFFYASADRDCLEKHAIAALLRLLPKVSADLRAIRRAGGCEVRLLTQESITHPQLEETQTHGGDYWTAETSSRCPHIAWAVFRGILRAKGIPQGEEFEVYHIADGSVGELTPMTLYCKA